MLDDNLRVLDENLEYSGWKAILGVAIPCIILNGKFSRHPPQYLHPIQSILILLNLNFDTLTPNL